MSLETEVQQLQQTLIVTEQQEPQSEATVGTKSPTPDSLTSGKRFSNLSSFPPVPVSDPCSCL